MAARLLISDANIIIDMNTGGLLRLMFRFDATFAVPDVLYEEELRTDHPELLRLGLKLLELRGDTVAYAGRSSASRGARFLAHHGSQSGEAPSVAPVR